MRADDNPEVAEVERKLEVLENNLETLEQVATDLLDGADDPLPYLSLAQAFHDERELLRQTKHGSPDDKEAALDHTRSNLATIREDADNSAIEAIDEVVAGKLQHW